jgi:hypothetical protein
MDRPLAPQDIDMPIVSSLAPLTNPPTDVAPTGAAVVNSGPLTAPQVVLLEDCHALRGHEGAWQALADQALEPNSFVEPWMFLPALENERPAPNLVFALVFVPDPAKSGKPLLAGVCPLERKGRY